MTCVLDRCDRKVDPRWCLCGEHWRTVPDPLRADLSRAYNPHRALGEQAEGFYVALAKVQGWIRKTFGSGPEKQTVSWAQLVAWVRERDAARGRPTPAVCLAPWSPREAPPPQQLRLVE